MAIEHNRTNLPSIASDTAVILHLYYPDLWDEIKIYLANLKDGFDLYVSICDTAADSTEEVVRQDYPNAFVVRLENRGRDIGPFMEIYPAIAKQYRLVCKIHSKKSLHLSAGENWRQQLYGDLLGSTKRILEIKAMFELYPDIGLIGSAGSLLQCKDRLGENAEKMYELAQEIGANVQDVLDGEFSAGSMFWFRTEALMPLLNLNITQKKFENERGQLDGTMAHTMERIFSLVVSVAGYKTVDTGFIDAANYFFDADLFSDRIHPQTLRMTTLTLKKMAQCHLQAKIFNQQIELIYNSRSWRITRPFRFVMEQFLLRFWLNPYFGGKFFKFIRRVKQ